MKTKTLQKCEHEFTNYENERITGIEYEENLVIQVDNICGDCGIKVSSEEHYFTFNYSKDYESRREIIQ